MVRPRKKRPETTRLSEANELWRVERTARYLDVSAKRIYQLVDEGRLPALRLGRRCLRIPRSAIEQLIADAAQATTRGNSDGPFPHEL